MQLGQEAYTLCKHENGHSLSYCLVCLSGRPCWAGCNLAGNMYAKLERDG